MYQVAPRDPNKIWNHFVKIIAKSEIIVELINALLNKVIYILLIFICVEDMHFFLVRELVLLKKCTK